MKIENKCLDQLFHKARTYYGWHDKSIEDTLVQQIYDLAKLGPTSANCSPLRIVFIKSAEAKARLKPYLDPGNVTKTMTAPVTAIFAYDLKFYEHFPHLFPYMDMKSVFEGNKDLIQPTAFRNSTLQAAYFIIAARALGLDCGPMSGFDNQGVDREFFSDGRFKSNFLCNLGYGNPDSLYGPRAQRLSFEESCEIL